MLRGTRVRRDDGGRAPQQSGAPLRAVPAQFRRAHRLAPHPRHAALPAARPSACAQAAKLRGDYGTYIAKEAQSMAQSAAGMVSGGVGGAPTSATMGTAGATGGGGGVFGASSGGGDAATLQRTTTTQSGPGGTFSATQEKKY